MSNIIIIMNYSKLLIQPLMNTLHIYQHSLLRFKHQTHHKLQTSYSSRCFFNNSFLFNVRMYSSVLFFFGASKRQWLLLIGGGLALAATAWFAFLSPYQKARVETFLNPAADPLGSGYNVRQSIVAVGSGQVAGRGIGLGSQSQLNFLPEQYTDFIFSAIAEELGLLGSATILVLLGTMLYRLVIIARRSEDDFGTLVALGLAGWLGVQAFINLGGALGLLPLTGLTLPLVSAGGSSLIAVLVSLGVAQSIALRGRQGFG
jgi:rod shape determining protein RodA